MSIPAENLGNSAEKAPPQAKTSPDAKPLDFLEVHTKLKEQQADNVEFISGPEKMKPEEKKELLEKAKQWQTGGDLDLLRAAGLSLDQIKQNPLDRHVRLAAMYLTRQTTSSQLEFKLDYKDNEQALWDLDLADLLPPNILTIDIIDQDGKVVFANAKRGFRAGLPGYFGANNDHASAQSGWKIRVKETQSSAAIKDQRQGKQTYENAFKEELYQVDNAKKSILKSEVRTQAAKKNQEVVTDKNFFDKFLTDLMKTVNPAFNGDFQKDGKVDFSKFLDTILTSIFGISVAKNATDSAVPGQLVDSTSSSSSSSEALKTDSPKVEADKSAAPKPSPSKKTAFDQSQQEKLSKSTEKFSSVIDRNWLLEHVGRSNEEVQKYMVSINFMGATMRVNKLIAPYLVEASERIKAAKIDFHCHQGQCSCQNWRAIRGGTSQSMHSWGTAIDLNVDTNPWQPNLKGNNHGGKMISDMPPEVVNIMKNVGFSWGGEWAGPADPMHFEMKANPLASRNVLRSEAAQSAASKYLT